MKKLITYERASRLIILLFGLFLLFHGAIIIGIMFFDFAPVEFFQIWIKPLNGLTPQANVALPQNEKNSIYTSPALEIVYTKTQLHSTLGSGFWEPRASPKPNELKTHPPPQRPFAEDLCDDEKR